MKLSGEIIKLEVVYFLWMYHPSSLDPCVLQAEGELPAQDLTVYPLPPIPSQPVVPPGHGSGVMEPGYVFAQPVPEPGWKISRMANEGSFGRPLRSMLPASSLEKWEDIAAKVDSKCEVDAAGRWLDSRNPSIGVDGPVQYANPEEACENANTACKLFKPPPGSSDPLDPNDMCQV